MIGSIEKSITLELNDSGVQERMTVRQGDSLVHRIRIKLTSGGRAYTPSGVLMAEVWALLPDGSTVTADCEVSGGVCIFVPGAGFFEAGGPVICRLILRGEDGAELFSPAFAFDTEGDSFGGMRNAEARDYSRIGELLLQVLDIKRQCEEIALMGGSTDGEKLSAAEDDHFILYSPEDGGYKRFTWESLTNCIRGYIDGRVSAASLRDTATGYTASLPTLRRDSVIALDSDVMELEETLSSRIAEKEQLKPEFANDTTECTDTSKLYVLPDGFIYAYMYTEVSDGGYENVVDPSDSDFKKGQRYNASNAITSSSVETADCFVSNVFSLKNGDVLRIKGVRASTSNNSAAPIFVVAPMLADGSAHSAAPTLYLGKPLGASVTTARQCWDAFTTLDDGTIEWNYGRNNAGTLMTTADCVKARIAGVATDGIGNVIVTVNEEIVPPVIRKVYAWVNTGRAFVPADYEERIVNAERNIDAVSDIVSDNTAAIEALRESLDSVGPAGSVSSGAKWYALGDSITEGYASELTGIESSPYRSYMASAPDRWVNILADMNDYTLTNKGIGGTGYVYNKNGALRNARELADDTDFSKCDMVTLAYGVNDWKNAVPLGTMDDDIETGGTMVSNMRYVIRKILSDNPYCKIFVITPLNCRSYGSYSTNWGIGYKGGTGGHLNSLGLEDFFEKQKEVCEYHGIEMIDMTHSSIVNRDNITTMLADYVHPTEECHRVIARELSGKINFR